MLLQVNTLQEPRVEQGFNPAPRYQRAQPIGAAISDTRLGLGLLATWGRRSHAPPGPFRFRALGPSSAIAAGRIMPGALPARAANCCSSRYRATAAALPCLLRSCLRAIFKLPQNQSRCSGRKEPAKGAVSRGCGLKPRERLPELQVSAAPGAAVRGSGALDSRAVPAGPRGCRRKWGGAGRGDSSLALLPTPLPFYAGL